MSSLLVIYATEYLCICPFLIHDLSRQVPLVE